MLLAEVTRHADDVWPVSPDDGGVGVLWIGPTLDAICPDDTVRRAIWLSVWRRQGPEAPVVCGDHHGANRPDRWAQCGRVRVVDALRGRSCDTVTNMVDTP